MRNFADFPSFISISAIIIGLGLTSCREPEPRVYTEAAFKPIAVPRTGAGMAGDMSMPVNSSPVDIKVTWTLPEGWAVKDSAGSMRVGSFLAPDPSLINMGAMDPRAVDVSVVQLAGDGGGLKANIQRWMGQVGIKATPEEMDEFVKEALRFKTLTGQDGMYVDLTGKLSGDITQSKTIFGAVVQTETYTVFVKGMGDQTRVEAVKPVMMEFCESLRIEGPAS